MTATDKAGANGRARTRRDSLSSAEARRLAIQAQGLGTAPATPAAPVAREIRKAIRQLGLLQIDSVNVLVRAHYLPLFSRLGTYACDLVDAEAYCGRKRSLFEYWGHEASLLPVETQPLLRWRMEDAARGIGLWRGIAEFGRENPGFIAEVRRQIADNGPLAASGLSHGNKSEGAWWGWSKGKLALEWLFWAGEITTAKRETAGFARVYDLTERVLPTRILGTAAPTREEAQRDLLRHGARALGIATATDLRDYFRLPASDAKLRIPELVENGDLLPVTVEGWSQQAYLDPRARVPREVSGAALLAPFDPLVWERKRTERLFDFHYRLEIYTPAEKRVHGYYVLPFLLGDRLAARLCLKADRAASALVVNKVHGEDGLEHEAIVAPLAGELLRMASWLGLDEVRIGRRGALAPALRAALRQR